MSPLHQETQKKNQWVGGRCLKCDGIFSSVNCAWCLGEWTVCSSLAPASYCNSGQKNQQIRACWQNGRLPVPEGTVPCGEPEVTCVSRNGRLGKGIEISSSSCSMLSVNEYVVVWQNLEVVGVASELLVCLA
eukprot:1158746-Pelagomonas_calceolata.AAC.4